MLNLRKTLTLFILLPVFCLPAYSQRSDSFWRKMVNLISAPSMELENRWWLLLVTAAVVSGFYLMFSRIVDRYSARIASLPRKTSIWQTFPLRGWILVICMTCLGIVLKFIPGIPAAFTASFYSGLGPMLVVAAFRFVLNGKCE